MTRHVRDRDDHPTTASLLIEVADSSIRKDRTIKREIYADAGVPEYWVVDLTTWTIDVFTKPARSGYLLVERFDRNGTIRSKRVPNVVIRVRDIPGFTPKRRR